MTPTQDTIGFETLWAEACDKAQDAWIKAKPTPIVVYTPKGLFDDTPDLEQPVYYEAEGVCGFGWIVVKDSRTRFARWLAKHDIGTKSSYYGGRLISSCDLVPADRQSQSYDRKAVAVEAGAGILRQYGIDCYAMSRLD